MCAHVIADKDDDDVLQFHIVKARHTKKKGYITDLARDRERTFWFEEQSPPNGKD